MPEGNLRGSSRNVRWAQCWGEYTADGLAEVLGNRGTKLVTPIPVKCPGACSGDLYFPSRKWQLQPLKRGDCASFSLMKRT